MDLGQERQRPENARDRHGAERPRRPDRSLPRQERDRPEQAQERVERRQVGVGEYPRHRQQRKARGCSRGQSPAPAAGQSDDAHQHRKRSRRGKPARQHILSSRVRPLPEHLERLAERRGDAQQPAAQGRVLGIVMKNAVDHLRAQKIAAPLPESSRYRSAPDEHPVARRSSIRAHPASAPPPAPRRRPSPEPAGGQIGPHCAVDSAWRRDPRVMARPARSSGLSPRPHGCGKDVSFVALPIVPSLGPLMTRMNTPSPAPDRLPEVRAS